MAKLPPERLAAALRANLRRRKGPVGLDAPKAAPGAKDPGKPGEKPANPRPGPSKS